MALRTDTGTFPARPVICPGDDYILLHYLTCLAECKDIGHSGQRSLISTHMQLNKVRPYLALSCVMCAVAGYVDFLLSQVESKARIVLVC